MTWVLTLGGENLKKIKQKKQIVDLFTFFTQFGQSRPTSAVMIPSVSDSENFL